MHTIGCRLVFVMKVASVVWSRDRMCNKCNKNTHLPGQLSLIAQALEGPRTQMTTDACSAPSCCCSGGGGHP